jgi:hypothetical protein
VVFSAGLNPAETEEVRGSLSQTEGALFFAQPGFDQRHGLVAARFVAEEQPERQDLIRAALLHDVGKRHAGLGPVRRSLASAYTKLGGTPKGKWQAYMNHGPAGATELDQLGAERIIVEFAHNHHGERPDSISKENWTLLQAADGSRRKAEDGRRKQKPGGR